MSLEHRWSKRKQVCLDTIVFHRPFGLLRAEILDIGLEGVFIRGEHLKLPCPAIVELTFALDGDSKRSISHMEAIVIHHSRQGYGLMFKDFRFEAFQVLKDMLYAA